MSPYQALYGRLPLSLIPYPPGASKVAGVDELLMEQNRVTRQLKQNLLAAKLRMEEKANRKRRDVEFKVGDKVFVKLQPYWQITLAKLLSNKLAKRFYRPYEIVERIGKVAYRLDLPVTSKIHSVFHVSILKLFTGTSSEMWAGRSPEEATWEWLTDFQSAYPTCNLEDKVVSEDGGNVVRSFVVRRYEKIACYRGGTMYSTLGKWLEGLQGKFAIAKDPNKLLQKLGALSWIMAATSSSDSLTKTVEKMVVTQVDCNKCPRPKTMFYCTLIDVQGGAIQANVDVCDTEYFNGILRMDATYRIFRFVVSQVNGLAKKVLIMCFMIDGKRYYGHSVAKVDEAR
ncbi:hypothetical protein Tco_0658744 [Tanacetum coccineum]